ncbi:MAG: glycosyltransferase family 4 protein [Pseudomonadales bacterium]|nr:glycosyltransferase family 4 protein [Pseudomonadales bacterium]
MPKQKLLIISNLYPNSAEPTRGIFTKQIAEHLIDKYDIKVIAPLPWAPKWAKKLVASPVDVPFFEQIDNIDVYHPRYFVIPKIGRSLYGFFFFAGILLTLLKLQREFKPDLINVHWIYPDGFGAVLAAKLLGLSIVTHSLGCDINEYSKYFLRRQLIKYTLKNADRNIVVSDALKTKCIELGASADKTTVILNGVNNSIFFNRDKLELRKQLALPSETKIFLYAGNFNIEKGLCYLIEAYSMLSKNQSNIMLCVVGSGPLEQEINGQINSLGIGDTVKLCGRVPHSDIPLYLGAADFLCLPSLREGCPNIVLEALASGTPVLSSRVGAVPDVLASAEVPLGLMATPENSVELASIMEKALTMDWQVRENFQWMNWHDNADRIAEVFDESVSR